MSTRTSFDLLRSHVFQRTDHQAWQRDRLQQARGLAPTGHSEIVLSRTNFGHLAKLNRQVPWWGSTAVAAVARASSDGVRSGRCAGTRGAPGRFEAVGSWFGCGNDSWQHRRLAPARRSNNGNRSMVGGVPSCSASRERGSYVRAIDARNFWHAHGSLVRRLRGEFAGVMRSVSNSDAYFRTHRMSASGLRYYTNRLAIRSIPPRYRAFLEVR